jgi:hypothetical protein
LDQLEGKVAHWHHNAPATIAAAGKLPRVVGIGGPGGTRLLA